MPLTSLLQPTCCHVQPDEHSLSRLGGSRPSDHPASPAPRAGWVTQPTARFRQGRRWGTIAGASSPGWPASLALRRPTGVASPPPKGMPSVPGKSPRQALWAWRKPDDPAHMRPLSPPSLVAGIPASIPGARTDLYPCSTNGTVQSIRGAFHQRVPPPTPKLSLRHWPHGPPLVPWLGRQRPSFRHAFTPHTQGALDPRPKRLFAAGPLATCRPSASTTECPPTTPSHCPTPDVDRGEPRSHRATAPLAEHHRLDVLRPGVTWLRQPRRPPPRRPLAGADLPQPDQSKHPLSQARVEPRLEESEARRSCGMDLVRTDSPGPLGQAQRALEGRHPQPLAKGNREQPHPGCLPLRSSPNRS
jgi:hypothetical protein